MTPPPSLPARVPAALRSVLREESIAMGAWLLLSVMGLFTGCVGQRFEGEESTESSSQLAPALSDLPAPSDLPSASSAAAVTSPSISASFEPPPLASSALSAAAASETSSTEPAPDAGAPPPEAGSSAGEDTPPPCSEGECPLGECVESANVLSPYGVCYFIGYSASWADALTACADRGPGWTLLTIRSEEEHLFVSYELLSTTTWLGASDEQMPDYWRWQGDVAPFYIAVGQRGTAQNGAFIQWSEGEPSNLAAEERCARYEQDDYGIWGWSAANCNRLFEFICELRED